MFSAFARGRAIGGQDDDEFLSVLAGELDIHLQGRRQLTHADRAGDLGAAVGLEEGGRFGAVLEQDEATQQRLAVGRADLEGAVRSRKVSSN